MPDLMQKQPEDSRSKWSRDGARLKATEDSISDWREVGAQVTACTAGIFRQSIAAAVADRTGTAVGVRRPGALGSQ